MGAQAWRPQALTCKALLEVTRARQREARSDLNEALEITRDTGRAFQRARTLGASAWINKDDADTREAALREGEAILKEDVVGHGIFWFYRYAVETMLHIGDWDRVDRYASALEDYTREERLEWTDFVAARGRVLAEFGRGKRDVGTRAALERVRDVADASNLRLAIAAVTDALETW